MIESTVGIVTDIPLLPDRPIMPVVLTFDPVFALFVVNMGSVQNKKRFHSVDLGVLGTTENINPPALSIHSRIPNLL
jgi:hypothetical protein